MLEHAVPSAAQRSHWYEKLVGLLFHSPLPAESVAPTISFPSTVGADRLVGAVAATAAPALTAKTAAATATSVPTARPKYLIREPPPLPARLPHRQADPIHRLPR